MDIYINGASCISPQETFKTDNFLKNIIEYKTSHLKSIEPVYKETINPVKLRRMSKIIRMGLVCAIDSMYQAKCKMPDAINVGTGLGCVKDTEIFLNKLLDNDEQFLTPTSFINSTHNTIAAQIALWIKCYNQNFTFVHKNSSFEHALLESILLFRESNYKNILVGSIDELTSENFNLKKAINLWKPDGVSNLEMLNDKTEGIIGGEGSAFFVLSDKKRESSLAKLKYVDIKYKFNSESEISEHILKILKINKLNINDIDFILHGINGNPIEDKIYYELIDSLFKNNINGYYKHLSGEHDSASGFAFWLAANCIKENIIPETCLINKPKINKDLKNILIINHNQNKNYTFTLLQK